MYKHLSTLFFLVLSFMVVQAQEHFFKYPLSVKPLLNANFGEMRPNHFHMGLDLNTGAKENLAIYAPADGDLSRIKIETGGFGRALYLNHPNGTTTVYAHMNSFLPAVEQYLAKKQYEQETWKIDLTIPAGTFKFKKGQLIGYSGNTGASEGPHVHFEVRDTKTENALNPLRNGISVMDHVAPQVLKLAFYDYDKSIYEQTPVIIAVLKKGSSYVASKKIDVPFDHVMVGLVALDRLDGNANPNGIYKAILKKGNLPVAGFELNNISYDFTRSQNAHIDYAMRFKGGPYIQMLHRPKFFPLNIYTVIDGKPYLNNSNQFQAYQIDVSDANDNHSTVIFELRKHGVSMINGLQGQAMKWGIKNTLIYGDIRFEFPADAFYDAFHMHVSSTPSNQSFQKSNVYQVHPLYVPLNNYFQVSIKPNGIKLDSSRMLIKKSIKGRDEIKKAVSQKDGYVASFREFGSFELMEDLQPPVVSLNVSNGAEVTNGSLLIFSVSDNLKTIKSFEARVDGKWLLFKPTGSNYTYKVDEHFPLGEHFLTAVVLDEAGNRTSISVQLKRN